MTKMAKIKLAIPVYLANAYTYKDENKDFANLKQNERCLLESYVGGSLKKKFKNKYCFLLPIALSSSMADLCEFDTGFSTWASDDYTWISVCQEMWVLVADGWDKSIGVQAEIAYAKQIHKTIKYIDPSSLNFISEAAAEASTAVNYGL